jgi:hypothetical protein
MELEEINEFERNSQTLKNERNLWAARLKNQQDLNKQELDKIEKEKLQQIAVLRH